MYNWLKRLQIGNLTLDYSCRENVIVILMYVSKIFIPGKGLICDWYEAKEYAITSEQGQKISLVICTNCDLDKTFGCVGGPLAVNCSFNLKKKL